ncbi:hypothetical protein FACS189413_11470 [Bacteroidia bacterium]|nr:hypothetical protein FACS189463_3610 [Bacteroidia bacterium]GHU70724.1 hypothetical protein FACS189413_11470 [Bacteroidia bacterium]
MLIVSGSFFFRFTPTHDINVQVNINDSDTIIRIIVPLNLEQFVHVENTFTVVFDNIPKTELANLQVKVYYIDKITHLNQSCAYHYAYCKVDEFSKKQLIRTEKFISAKTQIAEAKISLFDYMIKKRLVFF